MSVRCVARVSSLGLLCLGAACGGSEEALGPEDCPGTPAEVSLDPVAPFWAGLLSLEFQSDEGVPGSVDIQSYSAGRGVWETTYGTLGQKEDGTFVALVRPVVSELGMDADFKLRVRSVLQGCPPSAWAESEGVTLGDPIKGTTWVAELGPADVGSYISVSLTGGAGTTEGPYGLASPTRVRHTVAFGEDSSVAETVEFELESASSGDLYDGCRFTLEYEGTWAQSLGSYDRVGVFGRRFTSMGGSTCFSPPLSELLLSQPGGGNSDLNDDVLYLYNIDYTRLLESPPGAARWQNYSMLQSFSSILADLGDVVGPDTAQISGYLNIFSPIYVKQ